MKSPVMRYHGAKFRLAEWVIQSFPDHHTYVEPFGGAAGVLLHKPRSKSEVYNDLDGEIVNVFRVLQDQASSAELKRRLGVTPYARAEFDISYEPTDDPIESARRVLIRSHMGFGSASATRHRTGFRVDSAREYGTAAHLWAAYPDAITAFTERLQGVLIENRDACALLHNHDRADTLFYLDPPYVHSERVMGGNSRYYQHEMTDDEHAALIAELKGMVGMVVLSGYDSDIYNDLLRGWDKRSTTARISAGRGTGVRTEVIWINEACQHAQTQKQFVFG